VSIDARAVRASYLIRQRFRYAYPGPIRHLRHRLVVAPPLVYGDQRRIDHSLIVAPPLNVVWDEDEFGNSTATVGAERIFEAVEFVYEATIERSMSLPPTIAASAITDPRYRGPSLLTAPSEEMRLVAKRLRARGGGPYALAERINHFVASHMRYVAGTTSVETAAAEAYALGTGV
jgi:transglutaminase-like putative cysteine protease